MDILAFFQSLIGDPSRILQSIVDGIIAAIFFWLINFLRTIPGSAKIIFSNCITKKFANGKPVYKIRYMNIGYRDLFESTRIVKLKISTGKKIIRSTYLEVGDDVTVPLIIGTKKWTDRYKAFAAEIFMNEKTFREFQNSDYYPPYITNKAKKGTLNLNDIFQHYAQKAHIELYISGDDSKIGRNIFTKKYEISDIKDGEFSSMPERNFTWLNRFLKFSSTQRKLETMMSKLEPIIQKGKTDV